MLEPKLPDNVWEALFEQTPAILRYVLGVLTLGLFSLAGVLYRWHRDDLAQVNERIDRLERVMDTRHQETNRILMQIATNTRRSAHSEDASSGD